MQCLARRIVDPGMLRLVKLWLKAPVETTWGMESGAWRVGGTEKPVCRKAVSSAH
jgi:hypothetical protein